MNIVNPAKNEWEVLPISMDFYKNMNEGENINLDLSQAKIYHNSADVSGDMIKPATFKKNSETQLEVAIMGGVAGNKYTLSFRAYISENKQLEEDVLIRVK